MFPNKRCLLNVSFIANRAIFNLNFSFVMGAPDSMVILFMGGPPSPAKLGGYRPCGRGDIITF